jgi:hypothetical protein
MRGHGGNGIYLSNRGLVLHAHRTLERQAAAALPAQRGCRRQKPGRHGASPGPHVWFAKQNLPPIYAGRLNPNLSDGPEWGAIVNNAVRVWRSGLGIDRRGNPIYAVVDYQTVGSLAVERLLARIRPR